MKRRFYVLIFIIILLLLGVSQQTNPVAAIETHLSVSVPEGLVYWLRAENNGDDFTGNHNGTIYGELPIQQEWSAMLLHLMGKKIMF